MLINKPRCRTHLFAAQDDVEKMENRAALTQNKRISDNREVLFSELLLQQCHQTFNTKY